MEKNSGLVLTVLTCCLGLLCWLVITHQNPKSTIDTRDRQFAIPEIDQVEKIFLSFRAAPPVTLEKRKGIWYVNDKYKAYPNAVENLLYVMKNMRIQSITPRNSHAFVMKSIANFGIKVEAYNKDNEKLRSYYIGAATNDEYGVYFIMENAAQSYIMELKNSRSNIRQRFDLSINDWRDRTIVDIDNAELKFFKLEYPYFLDSGFAAIKESGRLKLLDHRAMEVSAKPKTLSLQNYWDQIQKLNCESIQSNDSMVNVLQKTTPWAIMDYRMARGDTIRLHFFPLNDHKDNPLDWSPEFLRNGPYFHFLVLRNDGDLFKVQIQQIQHALRKRMDFLQ